MSAHSPLSHLFPRSALGASTRGHTLGAPRMYDTYVNLFFLGRRRATFEALIRAAGVQPGQRVLDVGSGTGYFARLLARAVGPEGLVVGVDASSEMIGYASRHTDRPFNCQFQLGTAEALSFPAEHFDVVVSSLMIHHLPHDLQATAVAEMQRVLRPGGAVLIAEAQLPRAQIWRVLARVHGLDRMAKAVPDLEPLLGSAGFEQVRRGEVQPWLQYARAVRPSSDGRT